MIVVGRKGHEFIAVVGADTGSFHDPQQHVLSEFHLRSGWLRSFRVISGLFRTAFLNVHRCFFLRLGDDLGQFVGFDFIAEMDTVESVERLGVNLPAALDVEGDFESLAFLHLGNVPHDVKAALAVFGGHGDIVSLALSVLHLPVLDFKLGRKHVVDVQVAERRVAVVLKQNQNLVAPFATKGYGLLASAEVSSVVNDLEAGCLGWLAGADGAETLGAEFHTGRSIDALVPGRWVRGTERIGDLDFLVRLQANGSSGTDGEHHGVALAVGRPMFLFDGDAFGEFSLVLIVIDGLSIDLDGHLLNIGCLEDTRNVVGDAHQVDRGGPFVDEGHGGLDFLRSVRAQAAGGVRLVDLGLQNFEFLFLKRHRSFSGLNGLGQHGVREVVREVGFGLSHDGSLFGLPFSVGRDVLVDVVHVKQELFTAFHADLEFGQIHSKGGSVLEDCLANPVVGALVFSDPHVREPAAERIEFSEGHA